MKIKTESKNSHHKNETEATFNEINEKTGKNSKT